MLAIIDGNFDRIGLLDFSNADQGCGEEIRKRSSTFIYPATSPELNPEERLNSDLKQVIGSKLPVETKENCASLSMIT